MRAIVLIFDTAAEQVEFIKTSGYAVANPDSLLMQEVPAKQAMTLLDKDARKAATKRRAAVKARMKRAAKAVRRGKKPGAKPSDVAAAVQAGMTPTVN